MEVDCKESYRQQIHGEVPFSTAYKDWGRFNPMKMKTVKAKIQIDQWNGSIGAKAELQCAWFRVSGIPSDKKSEETAA
jgi:hypothetical protein